MCVVLSCAPAGPFLPVSFFGSLLGSCAVDGVPDVDAGSGGVEGGGVVCGGVAGGTEAGGGVWSCRMPCADMVTAPARAIATATITADARRRRCIPLMLVRRCS